MPYEKAITVLMEVAPEFGGYEALFFPDFVEAYGQQHWDLSMDCHAVADPFLQCRVRRASVYSK